MPYFDDVLAAVEKHMKTTYPDGVRTARTADLDLYVAAGLIEPRDHDAAMAESIRLTTEARERRAGRAAV
jgi:hypothetical protein